MNRTILLGVGAALSAFGGYMAVPWHGAQGFFLVALIFLLIGALVPCLLLKEFYGWIRWAKILSSLSLFAYFIEIVGVKTGFPYGSFQYLNGLGPLIFGVPLILPFAWVPLVLGVWQVVARLFPSRGSRIMYTAWFLLVIDLVLDPGAVGLGLWRYASGGAYFAVPWSNFFGWIISGSVAGWIVSRLAKAPHGSLVGWSIPLISSLGFWFGVCLQKQFIIPALIAVCLSIGLLVLVYRDEKARFC